MVGRRNVYTIHYRTWKWGEEKEVFAIASTKAQAYDKAVFELIPKVEGELPYSAWVSGVTFQNGNYRTFNTCDGMAY